MRGWGTLQQGAHCHQQCLGIEGFGDVTFDSDSFSPQQVLFLCLGGQENDRDGRPLRPDVDCLVTVDKGDDSWNGRVGLITTLFPQVQIDSERTTAVIVGPPIMFKFAVLEALAKGLHGHDILCSLERRMKCGLGKCGHCQIRHVYVCKEGPVFTYNQVHQLREGI